MGTFHLSILTICVAPQKWGTKADTVIENWSFFQFVCSMVNVKNLWLCTFAQSVNEASDHHVPLFSKEWRLLPSWSLEQRRRQKKSSSWWLLLSWRARVGCGQSDCWPFLASFPASTSRSAPSRNSVSSPDDPPQPLAPPPAELITFTFPLEDIRASLVILAWNRSATAPLETKPRSGWLMAWQIIRRREQKESKDGNQQSAGLTDKYYAPSAKNRRSRRVLRVIFSWV